MSNTLKLGNGKWATGKDTLLGYNSENNNIKPLAFSFSRASSGTIINKDGLIETVGSGEPRIDFKDNTKGALLLEPTRSNIVTDSATGIFKLPTPSLINTLAPDNSNLAVIPIVYSVANRYEYIISGGTYSTNTKLTYSWYRKRISTPMVDTYLGDLRPSGVNLSYVGDTKQIESNVNGYDRFEAVLNITDGSATTTVRMYFGDLIGVGNSSIAYWGHQLEQGSYATSYIPTSGSAVTRIADTTSQTPPDGVIGQTEGVIYWEGIINGFDGNFSNIVTGEKNTTTSFAVLHKGSSSQFQCSVFDGSEKGKCIGGSVSVGETCKIAYAYKSGNFALYVNGVSVAISTDTWTPPSTIDDIYIGDTTSYFGNKESNTHKEVKLYNTRLSNAELQALTTI